MKREYKCKKFNFNWWLVGLTDGDGSFNVETLTFKISQKITNIKLLYFIKKSLGYGSVRKDKSGMINYLVKDKKSLKKLIKIFDEYNLLTNKYNSYLYFKKILEIYSIETISKDEKLEKINQLEKSSIKSSLINFNKFWLIGFTEAEGSFNITLKDKNRLCHSFDITQKLEGELLELIGLELLKNIKEYYLNIMKGKKSLEYKIWVKSFAYKNNYEKLLKTRNLLNKMN